MDFMGKGSVGGSLIRQRRLDTFRALLTSSARASNSRPNLFHQDCMNVLIIRSCVCIYLVCKTEGGEKKGLIFPSVVLIKSCSSF